MMLLRNAVPLQILFVTNLVLTSRPITRQSDAQVCDHCMCSYGRNALARTEYSCSMAESKLSSIVEVILFHNFDRILSYL